MGDPFTNQITTRLAPADFTFLIRNDLDLGAQWLAEKRLNAQPAQAGRLSKERQAEGDSQHEPKDRDRFNHPHHPESFLCG